MSVALQRGPVVVGSVLYGADEFVARLVWSRIEHLRDSQFAWAGCPALGVIRQGNLIGGVVFHNFRGHDVEMSGAFDRPDWALPATLRRLFLYPFVQLGLPRMTTITGKKNKRARQINERVGFRLEGVHRRALDGVQDACSYGMLREECRFLPKETA